MKERQQQQINIHNKHVKKMILLCSTPGAKEDKEHDNGTSITFAHLKEKTQYTFKVTEQKFTNMDDHPSTYTTLQQPSELY